MSDNKKINKIIEILLFEKRMKSIGACTVQYWCTECSFEYPLVNSKKEDGVNGINDYYVGHTLTCPRCGAKNKKDGTIVARNGLYDDRKKLVLMYEELERCLRKK